jgi:hypothetical protein
MSSSIRTQLYVLQEVPGKGKGLIATREISKGTCILSEKSIIRVSKVVLDDDHNRHTLSASIGRQVDALPLDQRRSFLSLRNIYMDGIASQYLVIVRTNALVFGNDATERGIFLNACRIKHLCDNNAQKFWNDNSKRHTIHALRNIKKGEEITICYLGILSNRRSRQESLQRKFAFTCLCHLCSLSPDQSEQSDGRLEEIRSLKSQINEDGMMGILKNPSKFLRCVDRQIQLYNEQGLNGAGLHRAFFNATQVTIANGDLARARTFAERAVYEGIVCEGRDSPAVILYKKLSYGSFKDEIYAISSRWKTTVDKIPQGLDPESFEDWLWRREKPKQNGQLVEFRNRSTFPAFDDLPEENYIDPEFYESADECFYQPRRHWLFLAEIVDFGALFRLKDVEDTTVPLFFYTEGRGSELKSSMVRNGYTAAILYAKHHAFAFSKLGI